MMFLRKTTRTSFNAANADSEKRDILGHSHGEIWLFVVILMLIPSIFFISWAKIISIYIYTSASILSAIVALKNERLFRWIIRTSACTVLIWMSYKVNHILPGQPIRGRLDQAMASEGWMASIFLCAFFPMFFFLNWVSFLHSEGEAK